MQSLMADYRIVLVNGPHHSGKDTVCNMFSKEFHPWGIINKRRVLGIHDKFSFPMKWSLAELLDEPYQDLEEHKLEPNLINGTSFVQAQINLSENFIKPTFGVDALGAMLSKRISRTMMHYQDGDFTVVFVISDSGFVEEAERVDKEHPGKVSIVRLYRDGKTFDGDSRSYIEEFVPKSGLRSVIDNNGTPEELFEMFKEFVGIVL